MFDAVAGPHGLLTGIQTIMSNHRQLTMYIMILHVRKRKFLVTMAPGSESSRE